MVLQLGVKPTWFNTTTIDGSTYVTPGTGSSSQDLHSYMIESQLPPVGDSVVPELLLKVLEPYRREGAFSVTFMCWLYSLDLISKGFGIFLPTSIYFFKVAYLMMMRE